MPAFMADKHRTRRWRASVQRGTIYRSLGYFETYEAAKVCGVCAPRARAESPDSLPPPTHRVVRTQAREDEERALMELQGLMPQNRQGRRGGARPYGGGAAATGHGGHGGHGGALAALPGMAARGPNEAAAAASALASGQTPARSDIMDARS